MFEVLAQRICTGTKSSRKLCTFLILLCFFFSMIVTNDVALLTFVPFTILILSLTAQEKHAPYVIVLQTVAANLGSTATPVGNPQNLYLYSYYDMNASSFFGTVLPVVLISLLFCFYYAASIHRKVSPSIFPGWPNFLLRAISYYTAFCLPFAFCLCFMLFIGELRFWVP